jgi:hypothetical protein
MASLVPAIRASVQDVGGVAGDPTGAQVSAHGSRAEDGVSLVDGLRIGNMYQSSNLTNMSLSPLLFDQVDVQLSGQSGETGTNGVIMNAIPKAGGNRFSGTALVSGSSPSLQGNNITEDLQQARPAERFDDAEEAVRHQRLSRRPDQAGQALVLRHVAVLHQLFLPGQPVLPGDVKSFVRVEDTSNQAYGGTYTYDNNIR